MDLIALLPAPLITLAVQLLKFFGAPETASPWLALILAAISTVLIHLFGVSQSWIQDVVALLIAWLGSMGTWEAIKNLIFGRLNHAAPTTTTTD